MSASFVDPFSAIVRADGVTLCNFFNGCGFGFTIFTGALLTFGSVSVSVAGEVVSGVFTEDGCQSVSINSVHSVLGWSSELIGTECMTPRIVCIATWSSLVMAAN